MIPIWRDKIFQAVPEYIYIYIYIYRERERERERRDIQHWSLYWYIGLEDCNIGACAGPFVTAAGILQPVYGFGSFPVYCDLYRDRDKKYWKLCNDPYLKENNITGCSVILILRKANIRRACLHWIHILRDPVFESTLASPDLAASNHLLLSIAV